MDRKRILMSVTGVAACGISVGMFKTASFGTDPFQTLMSGIHALAPIRFGTLYVLVNACLLLFAFFAERHYIGPATVLNLLLLGYIAELTQCVLEAWFPGMGLWGRILLLVIGIPFTCLAAALYFSANLGVSPYDSISLIVTNSWKKGSFKYNRIISDSVCVILGVIFCALSGQGPLVIMQTVGIGTIITMFFMGPLISWFRVHFMDRFAKVEQEV